MRAANLTLEQTFLSLLDQLTAKRIEEELDTPTYLERLRGGFKRVHDGSVVQERKLAEQPPPPTERAAARLAIAQDLAAFLRTEVAPRLAQIEETSFTPSAEALVLYVTNSQRYIAHLASFLDISLRDLKSVHEKFCAEANRAAVEAECQSVSAEIERRAMFRVLPLVWAVVITILVKIILAHNTSETLHYQAVSLLMISFFGTWILSIAIGVGGRNGRLRDLRKYTKNQLRQMLSISDKNTAVVTFPAIARFPDTGPCVLASGRLVFATPSNYYIGAEPPEANVWQRALSRIAPELRTRRVQHGRWRCHRKPP